MYVVQYVVMKCLCSHSQDGFRSAEFYAVIISLNSHMPCSCPVWSVIFISIGRSSCELDKPHKKRGVQALSQALSRLGPLHETRHTVAVYTDSQNIKGHRNPCVEAVSALT